MMSHALIAYYTKTDSTREIADEIGKILSERDITVDIRPFSAVEELDSYSYIIIGAPINGFKWFPEASQFVEANQTILQSKKTACFLLSYLLVKGRPFIQRKMRNALDDVIEMIHPSHVGYFGGRVDAAFPPFISWLFGISKDSPKDVRDWDMIRIWAKEIADEIRLNE